MTSTQENVLTKPQTSTGEPGDHERFAHYVDRKHGDWDAGYIEGREIVALCGKRWVPSADPQRFPICPDCKKIYELMEPGGADG